MKNLFPEDGSPHRGVGGREDIRADQEGEGEFRKLGQIISQISLFTGMAKTYIEHSYLYS